MDNEIMAKVQALDDDVQRILGKALRRAFVEGLAVGLRKGMTTGTIVGSLGTAVVYILLNWLFR